MRTTPGWSAPCLGTRMTVKAVARFWPERLMTLLRSSSNRNWAPGSRSPTVRGLNAKFLPHSHDAEPVPHSGDNLTSSYSRDSEALPHSGYHRPTAHQSNCESSTNPGYLLFEERGYVYTQRRAYQSGCNPRPAT